MKSKGFKFVSSRTLAANYVNLFLVIASNLYPLKIPENLWFSGVFRVCKVGILARNRLMVSIIQF